MCICFVSSTHAKTQSKMQAKEKRLQIQSQVQIMILLHYLLLIQGWYDLTSESASPDNEAQLLLILCLPAPAEY